MIPLTIENRAGKVKIDGIIHESAMDLLIDRMATLYGDDAVRNELKIGEVTAVHSDALESLEIEINSRGGSIKQGYRAYKTIMELRERGVHVTARITKLAASMGSIVAAAADRVLIESDAKIMIHDASMERRGTAKGMQEAADMLNAVSNELAAIYSNRMGKTVAEARELMIKETWMNAKEAVEMKLADEIYTAGKDAQKPKSKLERILDGEESNVQFDNDPRHMSIFAKLFPGNDEVAKIEAAVLENDGLRADLESAQARITELTALAEVNAQLTTELSGVQAKFEASEIKATEDAAKITELEAENIVSVEKISARAAELLASQGHARPVELVGDESLEAKTLTRDAFNQLKPYEKMSFVKSGGKLS